MSDNIILTILSIIFPPLGAYFKVNFDIHFWINVILTLLGYFPGLIHALYLIWFHQN